MGCFAFKQDQTAVEAKAMVMCVEVRLNRIQHLNSDGPKLR